MTIYNGWRGEFANDEFHAPHAAAFGTRDVVRVGAGLIALHD
jgi:hypothetical protein